MPYVYVDEVDEGIEAAEVVGIDEFREVTDENERLNVEIDELVSERNSLAESNEKLATELDDAKRRFANAFLTTPERIKSATATEVREESEPVTFDSLFAQRKGD